MTTIKLDAWSFELEYKKRIVRWINRALPVLLEELKRLTPEDTREMLESYKVTNAKVDGDSVVWVIWNEAEHAIFVEYGVEWVIFWYHKPKWKLFYTWVGNRTFARAVDNKRDEIISIIYQEINR